VIGPILWDSIKRFADLKRLPFSFLHGSNLLEQAQSAGRLQSLCTHFHPWMDCAPVSWKPQAAPADIIQWCHVCRQQLHCFAPICYSCNRPIHYDCSRRTLDYRYICFHCDIKPLDPSECTPQHLQQLQTVMNPYTDFIANEYFRRTHFKPDAPEEIGATLHKKILQ
jgi:hypothetical protein